MKKFLVTFERTVRVEVENDATEAQIKDAAVDMYNNPLDVEDVFLTDESITLITEEVD